MKLKLKLKQQLPREVLEDLARSGLDAKDAADLRISIPEPEGFGGAMRYRLRYFDLDGMTIDFHRDRFVSDPLPKYEGKERKYIQPKGKSPRLYLPPVAAPGWREVARNTQMMVILTEGEKKSACGVKHGFPVIGLGGVNNWVGKNGPINDLTLFKWKGRPVYIMFDSDTGTKENVRRAQQGLAEELRERGAVVSVVPIPTGPNDAKWGLDDFLVNRGKEGLKKLLEANEVADADALRDGFGFADLMAKDFPEPEWIVPHLIPEGFTLLAGPPKVGKSFFSVQIALAVAEGGKVFGGYQCKKPAEVLILALEDNPRRLKSRLKKMLNGGKLSNRATVFFQWPRADQGGLERLRKWLQAHPRTKLVIIDTFAKIRGQTRRKDASVYADDYQAVGVLKEIADEFQIGIVVLHHLRKTSAEDPFQEISGTTGLTGAADSLMILKRPLKENQGTLTLTGRDLAQGEFAVWFDKDGDLTWKVLGKAEDFPRVTAARREILDDLEKFGPAAPFEVAERLGKSRETIKKTMLRMRWNGDLMQANGGKYQLAPPSLLHPHTHILSSSSGSDESPVPSVPSVPSVPERGQGQRGQRLVLKLKPKQKAAITKDAA